jgi:hypothetical protein
MLRLSATVHDSANWSELMGDDRLTNTESLFPQLCNIERLRLGFKAVKKNRGSPGVDGITVTMELSLDEI